jgi:hypothetical protein
LVWRREMDSILSAKWQEYLSHSQSFMHGNYRNMDDHSVATVAGVTYVRHRLNSQRVSCSWF